ncbi:MAG: thioesterase family protein [Parasphingorhabdus sp.]|nr:thioesterase family protein [Parasphingorhabdus sp.]
MSSDGAVDLPVGWTQGRTAFGGLSTALAYQAAKDIDADLPPLRSAQIAFTGPLSGRLSATARILQRGRSTAFVAADVAGDDGPGLHCSFVFAKPRETTIATEDFAPPQFPPLPQAQQIRSGPEQFFTSQMEFVGKRIDTSIKTNRLTRWMRLKQRGGLDPAAEILCISDSLPPSVMGLLETNAMVSSMNWQINIIAPEIRTTDGWWLIDSHTHHAAGGSSSQFMSVWNSERELIAAGMQSVAYYA